MITREEIRNLELTNQDYKQLREYCRKNIEPEERVLLKDCCEEVDYMLTDFMLLNLCEGKSYDKMLQLYDLPRCREDFYLRCRLALYIWIRKYYED